MGAYGDESRRLRVGHAFCAIKFTHLVEGRGDFDHKDRRIQALIDAVKRKGNTRHKVPAGPDLQRWGKRKMTSLGGAKWEAVELWVAILDGFHFSLRISELEGLEDRDISPDKVGGANRVTVLIRGSKTDQQQVGSRRTLVATDCDMCHVNTMAEWMGAKGWRPHSGESFFSKSNGDRINRTLKEIATGNGIDASTAPTHSLRDGGAATLYAAGIDPIAIQRCGRWKSSIYTRYIWRDNLRLHHLSSELTSPTCLAAHLKVDT